MIAMIPGQHLRLFLKALHPPSKDLLLFCEKESGHSILKNNQKVILKHLIYNHTH